MFQTHARKIAFALSLVAAASMMIPAAPSVAAAAVSGDTAATTVRLEVEQAKPDISFFKMKILPMPVGNSGNTTHYSFKVQAEVGTLKDLRITMFTGHRGIGTNEWQGTSPAVEVPPQTFSAPDYRMAAITCVPKPHQYCDFGEIRVTTSNGGTDRSVNDTDGNKAWP